MAREAGAKAASISLNDKLQAWRRDNQEVAANSLRRLLHKPGSSLMIWLVIGIALALPVMLYVGLANIKDLSQRWDGEPRVLMFLKGELPDKKASILADELAGWPEISAVTYISPQQGLDEFQKVSGMPEVLGKLEKNPLPAVLEIVLAGDSPEDAEQLKAKLMALPQADFVQLDLQWVQRLATILEIGQRMVLVLVLLLSAGVLLVIGNITRSEIQGRSNEIMVVRLIGGTDTFIRRPFLYTGFWYGLGGGLLASVFVSAGLAWLNGPVTRLAGMYQSDFSLLHLSLSDTLALWMMAALLGVFGSSISVSRYLDEIEDI